MYMGSSEEDQLFQMVHGFMESESSPPLFSTSSLIPYNFTRCQTRTLILQEIVMSVSAAETQVIEDVLKYMREKLMVADTSGFKEWVVMRLKLDGYNASLCHTSWVTTIDCPAGEYEYIGIITTNRDKNVDESKKRLIVDIDFKSQFELARPTAAYKKLLESVPSVFVGDTYKLNKVMTLLCSAAKQSFRENDIHMPPWRTITFMQAKYKIISLDNNKNNNTDTSKTSSDWEPPKVKAKNIGTKGPSGLSYQFSTNFTTTPCC